MMEARAYTMKYTANKRKEEKSIKRSLQAKIDEIQDSVDIDDGDKLKHFRKYLDDLKIREQEDSALKLLAKYNIEGERPTKFFCQMTKKVKGMAQLDNVIIKEKYFNGVEQVFTIRDQSRIKWEVTIFYWNLY